MSYLCIFRSWKKGSKKLKLVIIKTETKRRTKIYHHEVFTGRIDRFCSIEYEDVTTDKIKACQNHCKERRNCDVLVSEQDPSCSSIDLLLSLTIIHIRFTNDCLENRFFQKYLLFQKYQIFRAFQVTKASALFQSCRETLCICFPKKFISSGYATTRYTY